MDPVRDAELYRGLEEKLGTTVATGLMERLPPAPVDRLATKEDVAVVSRDVTALRTDMEQRFDEVDQRFDRIDQRFVGVDQRFGGVDVALEGIKGEIAVLREQQQRAQVELLATVRSELITGLHVQGRQMVIALVGSLVGLTGAAWLLSQIAG